MRNFCYLSFFLAVMLVLSSCKKPVDPTPVRPDADYTVELYPGDYKIMKYREGTTFNIDLINFNGTIAWLKDNEYSVKLEQNGHATCLCYGQVTITAIDDDGNTANCVIKVAEGARKYKLVWSDEFNGNSLDKSKWNVMDMTFIPTNLEKEAYKPENVTVSDGCLHLTAKKEHCVPPVGAVKEYSSGRIDTNGKFSQKYGKFEASIKFPKNSGGSWPAFWMLSASQPHGTIWPNSGEIDIMEHVGNEHTMLSNAIHTFNKKGGESWQKKTYWDDLEDGEFHTYTLEWIEKYWSGKDALIFYKDGERLIVKMANDVIDFVNWKDWPFDSDFYIILNLAVGGTWGGDISDATLPWDMQVDWVRVYQREQ